MQLTGLDRVPVFVTMYFSRETQFYNVLQIQLFPFQLEFKNPSHHCLDIALVFPSAILEPNRFGFSTKNLAHCGQSMYQTMVQMVLPIAPKIRERFTSSLLPCIGDDSGTRP